MTKTVLSLALAVVCATASWVAHLLAQATASGQMPMYEIIQTGGTLGLISCLVVAVTVLWKELRDERKSHRDHLEETHERWSAKVDVKVNELHDELIRQRDDMRAQMSSIRGHISDLSGGTTEPHP